MLFRNIYCRGLHKNVRAMISKLSKLMQRYRKVDQAILFLRLFVGGMLMLHVIGKLQRYNFLIDGYPPLMFNNPVASFVILTGLEALFAAMIMCGLWTRFAAFVMALGMFVDIFVVFSSLRWFGVERQVLYIGIYLFLVIAGGGRYAIDSLFYRRKSSE